MCQLQHDFGACCRSKERCSALPLSTLSEWLGSIHLMLKRCQPSRASYLLCVRRMKIACLVPCETAGATCPRGLLSMKLLPSANFAKSLAATKIIRNAHLRTPGERLPESAALPATRSMCLRSCLLFMFFFKCHTAMRFPLRGGDAAPDSLDSHFEGSGGASRYAKTKAVVRGTQL